jgi:hypothetical protein
MAACAEAEVKPSPGSPWTADMTRHMPAAAPEGLARAGSCCASLADLPDRKFEREGLLTLEIGPESPAFDFDSGKSFFAALRLPDWPRSRRRPARGLRRARGIAAARSRVALGRGTLSVDGGARGAQALRSFPVRAKVVPAILARRSPGIAQRVDIRA